MSLTDDRATLKDLAACAVVDVSAAVSLIRELQSRRAPCEIRHLVGLACPTGRITVQGFDHLVDALALVRFLDARR